MINYRLKNFLVTFMFAVLPFIVFCNNTDRILTNNGGTGNLLNDTIENDTVEREVLEEEVFDDEQQDIEKEEDEPPAEPELQQEDLELLEEIAREAEKREQRLASHSFDYEDVAFRVANEDYYYLRDGLEYEDEEYLFFRAVHDRPLAEVRIYPEEEGLPLEELEIIPSADFEVIDPLVFLNNEYHRTRIRFDDLREAEYLNLIISHKNKQGNVENREIKLYPYFVSSVIYDRDPIELFQGEEKTIDLPAQNVFNIRVTGEWKTAGDFEYRITRSGSNLRLVVKAHSTGAQELPLPLETLGPRVNEEGEVTHRLDTLNLQFNVKPSRIPFVNIDKEYIFYDDDRRRGQDVRMGYQSGFQLNRTYRIEGQQEPGGALIAELHTKSITTDDKILAEIRPYDFHRTNDGYLYIKDGEQTLAMTNFNIISRPEITNIEIMREGQDWTSSLNVYPGEEFEVKVEGSGLLDADILFDGCRQQRDSSRISDRVNFFELEVPVDITRRQIMVFLNNEITQHELRVREYKRPADLDFVNIDYGEDNILLTDDHFNKPVFYPGTIRDINITFDPEKIDKDGRLHGKQHLDIEVRILDDDDKLLDIQTLNNVVVCPGENSPRHAFYQTDDCDSEVIRLNEHLLRNTYLLDAFSQIILTVSHNDNEYNSPGRGKTVNIFVERTRNFDIMVSFPTGLLVKSFHEPGIGNLSGISTSVLAEISFYDPNRIGQKRPYKIGAGFIALNAFNFRESDNIRRDIGALVMGSLEPVRGDAKFSFPIYLGMGYFLDAGEFFAIFGPGIRLRF